MATALTVGGWFASAFINTLVDKAGSYAIKQFGLRSGLRDDLESLKSSLLKIRAVLNVAEKRQDKENILAPLINQLRDVAYDAEDVLGEFEYQHLHQKPQGGDQASDFVSSYLTPAAKFLSLRDDEDDDDDASRIREIQRRLDSIFADIKDVIDLLVPDDVGRNREVSVRRETSSFSGEPVVFGRDEEREKVVEFLLRSGAGSESSRTVPVLPLVGIGGVGKTTLAQLVYNHPRVVDYFQVKIWVCVSDHFDVKRLTKEMIDSMDRQCSDLANLNKLQEILKEELMGKRYLLVLDDVWSEDRSKWDNLRSPLMFGAQGSKILVTTRTRRVADIMGTMDPIFLHGLPDDAYWLFFCYCAFGFAKPEQHPKLEAIGKKIAKRLKGSPLAAKTLGALLNSKLVERHWRSVMDSELCELEQGENGVLPILRLSYNYLPAHLKQCFAYCSVFPKDYKFERIVLVRIWMAQGFITPRENMLMEDVGSEYLQDLLCRSFFQPWDHGHVVMHDLIHDLAMSLSGGECCRIEDKTQKISSTLRHLSVCTDNMELAELDSIDCKKLRTLIFFHGYKTDYGQLFHDLFGRLASIRVLILNQCGLKELPDNIGNLKHLRYLDISYNATISRLPESFSCLYNLLVLVVNVNYLISFPQDITKLINLSQVIKKSFNGCIDYDLPMMAGIGKLTSLQALSLFKIREGGQNIRELRDMMELRRLCIENLENVPSKEEATRAKLSNKRFLDELRLGWGYDTDASLGNDVLDLEVLEGLQPHPNLKVLEISKYMGVRSPSWLESLSNLETLFLFTSKRLVQLPSLGQLRFLEKIRFSDMPEWEVWSGAEGAQLFPRLRELHMYDCPKLRDLPPLPPSLKEFHISNVGLSTLDGLWEELVTLYIMFCEELVSLPLGWWKSMVSLKELRIGWCPKLISVMQGQEEAGLFLPSSLQVLELKSCGDLDKSLPGCLQNLTSLRTLVLRCCPHIRSLPGEVLRHLTALQNLTIWDCEVLKSLGGLQALTSLEHLSIGGCPKLMASPPLDDEVKGEGLSSLRSLCVDDTSLIKLLSPRERLPSLWRLTIHLSLQVTLFTTEEEQEWLQNQTSLWLLHLWDCEMVQSLPEKGLPNCIQELWIFGGHPELERRCLKDTGEDWPKIAHINSIDISGRGSWR